MLPKLADLRVVETIHEGTRSRVHRALRADGTPLILKELRSERPEPVEVAWFRREYEVQRGLDLPSVLKAYALESHGWSWTLVLEDFGGTSLDRLIGSRSWTLGERLRIAIAAAGALGQLHAKNVIHKDITPANLVWNAATGTLKIIDLGLSTVLPRETPEIRSLGALGGTLRYISPEQTGRVNRAIDYRSDFYSLGATLYELFTGVPPFSSDNPMELVHGHIARRPVDPCERKASIQRALSDVIMKLLAKTPEARYQSTYGLVWDLEHCLKEGEGRPFEPGTHDRAERFQVPQELYGRDRELGALLAAFEQVASAGERGGDALTLVTGYSGIGKSSLVRELYRPITTCQGQFVTGKFEQLERSRPYSAFVAAFGSLVRFLLGESEGELSIWRTRLLTALRSNGRIVTDLIPELELIVGPQPPIAELGPTEAQNRFNSVFGDFIRVFARPSQPLVVFLDDLQWADTGSLKLIELLFKDDEPHSLLVIGAYRDHEVGPGHPLLLTIGALEKAQVSIHRIPLLPLGVDDITRLVADTVGRPKGEVLELALVVARKTEGNPLFVTELLKSLYEEGLLDFDRATGRWRWNVARISSRGVASSVVDLMVGKLRRLPEETQRALQLAACVGGTFDLDTAAIALEVSLPEVFRLLLPALKEGFLAAISALVIADAGTPDSPLVIRDFRFVHDRIQQAAYNMIPESERAGVHLRIGRLLRDLRGGADDQLFQVVDQLDRGIHLIEGKERLDLARLNLDAALLARRSLAYGAAKTYLEKGIACLSEDTWREDYDLAFTLHKELCATEFLNGEYERSEALCKRMLERARTPIDKGEIYLTLVAQSTMRARYAEALAEAKVGLQLFGVDLPLGLTEGELATAMLAELTEVDRHLGGRDVASLLDQPEVTDPASRTVSSLLLKILPSTFHVSTTLYVFVVCKAVGVLLRDGPAPPCVDLFSNYGHILSAVRGDYQAAYAFGKLAVDLSERFHRPDCKSRSAYHLADWISALSHPLRESDGWSDLAFHAGLEGGDRIYTGYTLIWWPFNRYHEGRSLDEVAPGVIEGLQFNRKTENRIATDILLALDLIVENARGATASAAEFRGHDLDEAAFLTMCQENKSAMAIASYYLLKEEVLYLYQDWEGSLAAHAAAEEHLSFILGWYGIGYHVLYQALCRAALHAGHSAEERARTEEIFAAAKARFATLAAACPENYGHLQALLLGEIARVSGKPSEAADLYEQAIAGARREGFTQHLALAAELASRLWRDRGHPRLATAYLQDALHGYKLRGMTRKVQLLEAQHPELARGAESHRRPREVSVTESSDPHATGLLDLASVIKASQALSSEIVLDRLLTKLLQIVLENGGARRGALVLERGGELVVAVDARVEDTGADAAIVGALRSTPIQGYADASEEIIRYVARTRQTVILADATREGAFVKSPYVERTKPKSVLSTAFTSQGRLLAILYMENNLTTGAFTPERLEVLGMLSSQIAISMENAFLYHEIEERVRQRTLELSQRNGELQDAILHLRTTQGQLVQSEKMASLGRLTTGIAHELKNPLNFVNNFAVLEVELVEELEQTAASDAGARLADVRDLLEDLKLNAEKIREHSKRADDIVQTMVKHSAHGSGGRRAIDLNAHIDACARVAQSGAQAKPSPVEVRIESDLDPMVGRVPVVPHDIGRVFVNLFDNAIDAVTARSRAAGAVYAPSIRAITRRDGGSVRIEVRDNGEGIPPRIKDRVFEPFFTTRPPGQGTGLGLSLSYDIVVSGHDGSLTFESVEGEATVFVITLPAPLEQAAAAEIERNAHG